MNASKGRILIVDDDADIRETLRDRLEMEGFQVSTAASGVEGLQRVEGEDPDVVLLDLQMPGMDGMEVLEQMGGEEFHPTVVVVTAYGSIERAVKAMTAGAFDFIPKPFEPDRIGVVVEKAMERERLRRDNAYFRREAVAAVPDLLCQSLQMQEMLAIARRAADSMATVLLLGESGTGKEVVARKIHHWSPRRDRPFVAVNCVAMPESLLESELFGHEKGAFTGADRQKKGKFEIARGGTIFLDEIGATRTDLQLKLLRVLQDGSFERIGGNRLMQADVRVIAATNRDLQRGMAEGKFLEDLFYRLNVVTLTLAPLRERRGDIPILARYFLEKYVHEAKRAVTGISERALNAMGKYDWPGNVREMENAIERAVVLGLGEEIDAEDLPEQVLRGESAQDDMGMGTGYHASIQAFKGKLILQALEQSGGNQSQAAHSLGLQRTYLSRLIKNLGLKRKKENYTDS
jgi:DNA-binding NtrC family response regulator